MIFNGQLHLVESWTVFNELRVICANEQYPTSQLIFKQSHHLLYRTSGRQCWTNINHSSYSSPKKLSGFVEQLLLSPQHLPTPLNAELFRNSCYYWLNCGHMILCPPPEHLWSLYTSHQWGWTVRQTEVSDRELVLQVWSRPDMCPLLSLQVNPHILMTTDPLLQE